ncbi:uncharacterized protein MONOS_8902 [Monocercomonoides exilis]|uniref:uncharacterized protein n=1 Tax=Monocercomonoides exilis TaxID=2049356 RepID=UPI0035597AFD|nr:hypothetical protein MONOS_8902 [Monocercomonoides exilis]|eukprot:MONOS_8902.1-p1 / transcript=MONOS_8902.1 / gene=MONOS_8902 / organism=Monocercomonoides_exilis_PA203 / gene_product=unspecified product / transcript_product=unspecified product / location=Mono_scaffold00350:1837-4263(-) / protein_length=572 / sequence_SO=supercontig / SO=protein_coding / is_pseudo=false
MDYGYDVTEGKFINAKQTLKKNQGFIIPPQKPHLPSCKSGLNEQEWEKGNNWMLVHSTEASTSLQSAKKKQRAEPDYARFIDEDAWENEIVTENSSSNKKQSSSSSTSSQLNTNSKTISEKNSPSSNSSSSQAVDAPINTPIRRERAKGLPNLGNTCYLASLLQCFSSITIQKPSLFKKQTSLKNTSSRVESVCHQLAKDGTSVRSWVPSLINKWETFCGYSSRQQQNVTEAFENLHQLLQDNKIFEMDTFNPVIITHLKCQKCQQITSNFNEICNNVVINSSSTHNGLSSLFATEVLEGKNSVYCDECNEKCCAARWEEMAAFPEVLALCHESTDAASSAPSRTLLIETDRVNQRTFCKGYSEENIQHLQESNKEIIIYHLSGQILFKRLDQRNGHYIAVVKRKTRSDVLWNICNDESVSEFDKDNWNSSWKDIYAQGYTPSLSFYTKEKTKPTFSTIQFGGSSSSSETSNNNTSNNSSSSSSSSSSTFITPPHRTTSIPQLTSSITSSYGLEALKEKRKKTGIFSPNEKRLIFKVQNKIMERVFRRNEYQSFSFPFLQTHHQLLESKKTN